LIRLAQMGKTLMVTSHILPELARICHRMAIMTHGKLRAFGTMEEISKMVSQQRTIEAQLTSVEQIAAAAAIIRRSVESDAEVIESPTEASVRFRTAKPEAQLAELLTQLIQGGIRVNQFREVQTDLEEAFMSFARPGATVASAAAPGGRLNG
jgi:ABC-2 type transport system ATP-binding protein